MICLQLFAAKPGLPKTRNRGRKGFVLAESGRGSGYSATRCSWRHMAIRRNAAALMIAASLTPCCSDSTAVAKRCRPTSVDVGDPSYSQAHSSHAASDTPRRMCSRGLAGVQSGRCWRLRQALVFREKT
jgi:hypothetical protein